MSGYLVFDIETVLNPEVSWTPPPDDPKKFPPIQAHKVVAIGGLSILTPGDPQPQYLCTFGRDAEYTEYNILLDFFNTVEDSKLTLVSWNGRSFDVPVLVSRAMRYGFQLPWAFSRDFRYRYSPIGHLDLCDEMSDFGAAGRSHLAYASEAIGLPGKMEGVDGSQVQKLIDDMQFDTVREYVMLDVIETALLLLRWQHVKGHLNETSYNKAVDAIRVLALNKSTKDGLLLQALRQTHWDILMLPASRPEGNGDELPV
jgi:predicted PolB exonuclease-like 3'-5' exonuclease